MHHEVEHVLERLREEPFYRNYELVRREVLAMLREQSGEGDLPSSYWREELAGFEYMLDASPLVIQKLRHHTYHVTGLRVYDYRTGKSRAQQAFEGKLQSLLAVGDRELLVPESPALGGFGYEIDGALYNVDTLKFFEAFTALRRAEALPALEGPDRRIVVEIGGGWGGFAYQLKTLFPHVTYVIVDLPEVFLFSAVYLLTLFPDARVVFATDGTEASEIESADFVFVPHTRLRATPIGRPDLVVNMVSFQEMTSAQVAEYAGWAHGLGSPFLYSLNRDRSLYNEELSSVREILREQFWLREIFVLPVSYNEMMQSKTKRPRIKLGVDDPAKDSDDRYRHIVGSPKILLAS
jgi:hypothetical protein